MNLICFDLGSEIYTNRWYLHKWSIGACCRFVPTESFLFIFAAFHLRTKLWLLPCIIHHVSAKPMEMGPFLGFHSNFLKCGANNTGEKDVLYQWLSGTKIFAGSQRSRSKWNRPLCEYEWRYMCNGLWGLEITFDRVPKTTTVLFSLAIFVL